MSEAIRDQNHVPVALGQSTASSSVTLPFKINSVTGRLLVDSSGGAGGTVTDFIFTDGNGFDGTVTDSTTTPTLSLTTSLTEGSIPFIGAGGALLEDNADLFWSASTDALQLGVGSTLEVFNLKTDATNYERVKIDWSSNIARLWTQNDGTGSGRSLRIGASSIDAATGPSVYSTWALNAPFIEHALSSAASTASIFHQLSAFSMSGSSGTQTAVGISPTFSQTSTAAGIALLVNPSGTFGSGGGDLIRLQLASADRLRVTSSGTMDVTGYIRSVTGFGLLTGFAGTMDVILERDAADILAQRRTTNAQTFRVYNTYTDASNYERVSLNFTSNVALLVQESAGTGTVRAMTIGTAGGTDLNFRTTGTNRWQVSSGGIFAAVADNTYDIGLTASNRPRTGYFGTSLVTPSLVLNGTTYTNDLTTATNTQTTTNKRNQPRTASSTSNAALTPDLASANVYYRTTQTTGLTINAPTGTPVIGETIMIYVDSAGAQTLTMDATYIPFGTAFPATTTAGKTLMISAQYNGTNWKTLWANAV